MNIIWTIIMIASMVILLFTNPTNIFSIMIDSVSSSLNLLLSLFCIYAVWLGFLKILEESKLANFLTKLFSPIINKLFGKVDNKTKKQISINLTSNLLGASNASTPAGLKAVENLKKENNTFAIIMLTILNCTSLQLLPSTLLGILSSNGASNPSKIILPIIIVSVISLVCAILLINIFYGKEKVKWLTFSPHF